MSDWGLVITRMWRLQQVFDKWHRQEEARFFFWLPVCLGAGMALYYALHDEPGLWLHAALPLLIGFLFIRKRLPRFIALLVLALLLAAAGASYAKFRTDAMGLTMLKAPLPIRSVSGTVHALQYVDKGVRITLSDVVIKGLEAVDTPGSVRVSFRARHMPDLTLGQRINLRAALLPPSGPAMPNAFDFSRYFFFRHIGAVGYAIPPILIEGETSRSGILEWIDETRDRMTAAIHRTLPGANGAVAAGLITGDDAAIPEQVNEELRAANLLHIIAISGAHMVVIGGIVFVALRCVLVLIPGFGQRPAVKSITAFLTLLAITAYVAITGFELSAVRAYVMLAFVLIAILVRRDTDPLRSIALAALVMLLYDPSDITEPGFQLSFAATLALIAAFDVWFRDSLLEGASLLQKLIRMFGFLCLTTIVAQAATTTIILFHFNNFTPYGMISNLILTPVVTFIIMPMVALYFVFLPFGTEQWALYLLDYGIDAMLYVARSVAAWPHALSYLPAVTEWGIALAVFGLLWLCLWQSRARRYGAIAVIIGTASLFTVQGPHLFLGPRAGQIAMDTHKGYVMLRGRSGSLFAELWANGTGNAHFTEYRLAKPLKEAECTRDSCVINTAGTRIHISHTVADIKKGCPDADIWISGYHFFPEERARCGSAMTFIDRNDFDAKGAHWAMLRDGKLQWHNTRMQQGLRPWSVGN